MVGLLMAMDYMVGVADQPYAAETLSRADRAIATARERGMLVVFTKVGFLVGHPEVSTRNPVFGALKGTDKLVGAASRLVDRFSPRDDEPVLDKKRFSAFAGSGLWSIVNASSATSVVLCGLSTSGVVLSTALELIDADYEVTVLADACADPDAAVHDAVMNGILAKRATVSTADDWVRSAAGTSVA